MALLNSPLILAGILPTFGPMELVIILVVVLLIFGPKNLPSLMRSMGKGVREFKSEATKFRDAVDETMREDEKKTESERKPEQLSEGTGRGVQAPPPPANVVTASGTNEDER